VQRFHETFPALKRAGHVHDMELEMRRKDGTLLPVLLTSTAVYDASGRYVSSRSTLFDLTERKKWERELERQARKDMLTGLNNRRYFHELAEQELARARRNGEALTLLMLDVDHFKQVNDTYGHDIGDAALKKLSEICTHTFRVIDIVGRLGGEEFAALLPETGTTQALEVAERLRQAVESAGIKLADGSIVRFTISIGVASSGATDDKVEKALKRADDALYRAKNEGRNRVCSEGNGGAGQTES
jgi:diguanylate cyclase (GGDEF)-like protein